MHLPTTKCASSTLFIVCKYSVVLYELAIELYYFIKFGSDHILFFERASSGEWSGWRWSVDRLELLQDSIQGRQVLQRTRPGIPIQPHPY